MVTRESKLLFIMTMVGLVSTFEYWVLLQKKIRTNLFLVLGTFIKIPMPTWSWYWVLL
jgi:hypothetical protein